MLIIGSSVPKVNNVFDWQLFFVKPVKKSNKKLCTMPDFISGMVHFHNMKRSLSLYLSFTLFDAAGWPTRSGKRSPMRSSM